jgi:hypothetical protein
MPKRESWLKIDRRLHEHPKVRRIAKAVGLHRFGVVGCLCYLWGYADDLGSCLGEDFDESEHELPPGMLAAMEAVGWAHRDESGSLCLSTRSGGPRSEEMRALAERRWDASRNADGMRSHATAYAEGMRPHRLAMQERGEREIEEKRQKRSGRRLRGSDPPTDPKGSSGPPIGPADIVASLRGLQA